ncbi:MAG TPA: GatB/YqeY domain-containing protein [Kiritimatiellia bacterium]|nr:GatB/YqeY domain-containing protein [Kiritimatiellia bacterium]HMP97588.1 GatB/YqeY domain-containing protein [Kiritimatiellia bacterium]
MSSIVEQLMSDIKAAMKSGDKERLVTLRSLHAQIKDATVNAGKDMSDDAVTAVIARQLKQRADAHTQFSAAGRADLAAVEEREIAILKAYQPAQLSEAEIEALVAEALAATGATTKKEMGKVMAALMPKVKGKADGALVNRVVAAKLV